MVDLDWKVTSVVVASELGWLDLPLGVGPSLLLGGLPPLLPLVPGDGIASGALAAEDEFIYGARRLGLLVSHLLELGRLALRQVVFGEVPERGVGILGRVVVLPGFIVNIFGPITLKFFCIFASTCFI